MNTTKNTTNTPFTNTNAGKSTLFNTLTQANVYVADQLFATLDPTLRRVSIPDFGPIVLADTVGFIRHLPHKLVEAFRATLEEAAQSDLLIHVIDCADEEREDNIAQVEVVLTEIGADAIPRLEIYNKIDLVDSKPRIDRDQDGIARRVWVSAQNGSGLDLIEQCLAEWLGEDIIHGRLTLDVGQGRLRAAFYQQNVVVSERYTEQGLSDIEIRLPKQDFCRLLSAEELDPQTVLAEMGAVAEI